MADRIRRLTVQKMNATHQSIHDHHTLFAGRDFQDRAVVANAYPYPWLAVFRPMEDPLNQLEFVHWGAQCWALPRWPARRSRTPLTNL